MLFARVTSFDQTSYCHFLSPSTPHKTRPVWIPTLIFSSTSVASTTDLNYFVNFALILNFALTQLHLSYQGPFLQHYEHGHGRARASLTRSSNNHQESLFANTDCPDKVIELHLKVGQLLNLLWGTILNGFAYKGEVCIWVKPSLMFLTWKIMILTFANWSNLPNSSLRSLTRS